MLSHLLILPGLYFAPPEVDGLRVSAEPAVAVIALQESGRKLVPLPEVEFRLSVSPDCASGGRAESLSITIADTRQTLDEKELQSAESVDVVMRVPASQLAPLALGEFCVDPVSEGESVLITSALVAQTSLRCSRDEDLSIVFAATPLDIRVDCIHSGATATEPIDD